MKMIASKQLTKTDLRKLTIPMESFPSFPQPQGHHAIDFPLRDIESRRVWPVGVETRKNGPYKKPVLARGWNKLVLEKKLRVGDKVSFFKEVDQGEPQYMIKVEKIDAPVHGTVEAIGTATNNVEEKGGIKIFGVIMNDAPIHGFETEEKREIKLFGVTLVDASVHGGVAA